MLNGIDLERKISQFESEILSCDNCINYIEGICVLNNVAVVDEYSNFDCDDFEIEETKQQLCRRI